MIGTIVGGALDVPGFQRAMIVTAALMFLGGLVSWVGIRRVLPVTGAAHPRPITGV
jgi:hypothetical protein